MKSQLLLNLIALNALLSAPERWTRRTYARNAQGDDVNYLGTAATCYCLVGATGHLDRGEYDERLVMERALYDALPEADRERKELLGPDELGLAFNNEFVIRRHLVRYNDHVARDFADIRALILRAIAKEEARETTP